METVALSQRCITIQLEVTLKVELYLLIPEDRICLLSHNVSDRMTPENQLWDEKVEKDDDEKEDEDENKDSEEKAEEE